MRFVVQKHQASRLHYDLRLEVQGALVSWAIPKGPSTDPGEKRLAIRVEDHSLDYIDYEGRIPEGEYGAGEVIVWDTGTYQNLKDKDMRRAIEDGHLSVYLQGEKLMGGYALTRFKQDEREKWLLVKMRDEWADEDTDILKDRPESVLTGRTIEELREN